MQYISEYRDRDKAKALSNEIAKEVMPARFYRFMEFCGGHTHVLSRWGLTDLLPDNVKMIHGPGCPVCVLPVGRIEMAIDLALSEKVILCTYADTLREPTSKGQSLFNCRSLDSLSLQEGVTSFGSYAFSGCTRLEEVSIPKTVSLIGEHAFGYTSGSPESKNTSIEEPAGTVTCTDHHAFVSAYYGNGHNHSVEVPAPTLTTKDRLSLVTSQFIDMQYRTGRAKSLESPAGAVTTVPKMNLVSAWLMNTNFRNVGNSLEQPAQTITANRKWFYLMNPQFSSPGGSVDKPCFTLIARMDKMPPYLVATETGEVAIQVFENDSPMMAKIKEFMAMYGIMDIKMRMLKISELKRIMGFPEDYVLVGTQADQKKFIGNAVEVNMARVLCEALCRSLSGIGNARNKRGRTSGTYSLTLNTQI